MCGQPMYLDAICSALPIQVTKLDRTNLEFMSPLLDDPNLKSNTKILYIIRDPRAIMNSRKHFPWCLDSKECISAKYDCRDHIKDYNEAKKLVKTIHHKSCKYPKNYFGLFEKKFRQLYFSKIRKCDFKMRHW
jgi:hypothetical protein